MPENVKKEGVRKILRTWMVPKAGTRGRGAFASLPDFGNYLNLSRPGLICGKLSVPILTLLYIPRYYYEHEACYLLMFVKKTFVTFKSV